MNKLKNDFLNFKMAMQYQNINDALIDGKEDERGQKSEGGGLQRELKEILVYPDPLETKYRNAIITPEEYFVTKKVRDRPPHAWIAAVGIPAALIGGTELYAFSRPIFYKLADAYKAWAKIHPKIAATITLGNGFISGVQLSSDEGVKKTINHFKNGENVKGIISGASDIIDVLGVANIGNSILRGINPYAIEAYKMALSQPFKEGTPIFVNAFKAGKCTYNAYRAAKINRIDSLKTALKDFKTQFNFDFNQKKPFSLLPVFYHRPPVFDMWYRDALQKNLLINNPYLDVYDVADNTPTVMNWLGKGVDYWRDFYNKPEVETKSYDIKDLINTPSQDKIQYQPITPLQAIKKYKKVE